MEIGIVSKKQNEIEKGIKELQLPMVSEGIALINCRAVYAAARANNPETHDIWTTIANLTYFITGGQLECSNGIYKLGHTSEQTQTVPNEGRQTQIVYPSISQG